MTGTASSTSLKYSPYPAYKPSGIDWLGDVPVGWEVKRLKQSCEIYPSNVDKKSNGSSPGSSVISSKHLST